MSLLINCECGRVVKARPKTKSWPKSSSTCPKITPSPPGSCHVRTSSRCRRRSTTSSTVGFRAMVEPTRDDLDALVGPATPHFAYQLRARVRELIEDLPDDHPLRKYGEEKMALLDRLGHASSSQRQGPASRRVVSAGRRSPRRLRRTTRFRRPNELRGRVRPRNGRIARHWEGDRASLRVARSGARRHRVHAR